MDIFFNFNFYFLTLVSDLENSPNSEARQESIKLALGFNLVTKYTSMVAIEKRKDATEGEMKTVDVGQVLIEKAVAISESKQVRPAIEFHASKEIQLSFIPGNFSKKRVHERIRRSRRGK